MSLPRPELILFDAVGTLIEPAPRVFEVYQRCGARHGSSLSQTEVRSRFSSAWTNAQAVRQMETAGRTSEAGELAFWRSVVGAVLEDLPISSRQAAFRELWDHFADPRHWRVFDDVAPTFAELRRRGFQIGIASNFDARLQPICAAYPELAGVEPIFVSSAIGWVKPATGFYREIERLTGLTAEQIAIVGDDQENDVLVPRQLGWQAWWLQRLCPADSERPLRSLTDLLTLAPYA